MLVLGSGGGVFYFICKLICSPPLLSSLLFGLSRCFTYSNSTVSLDAKAMQVSAYYFDFSVSVASGRFNTVQSFVSCYD